jgi:hypothetical protein
MATFLSLIDPSVVHQLRIVPCVDCNETIVETVLVSVRRSTTATAHAVNVEIAVRRSTAPFRHNLPATWSVIEKNGFRGARVRARGVTYTGTAVPQ